MYVMTEAGREAAPFSLSFPGAGRRVYCSRLTKGLFHYVTRVAKIPRARFPVAIGTTRPKTDPQLSIMIIYNSTWSIEKVK